MERAREEAAPPPRTSARFTPLSLRTFSKAVVFGCFIDVILMVLVSSLLPGLVGAILALVVATVAGVRFADLGRGADYLVVGAGVFVLTIIVGLIVGSIIFALFFRLY